MRKAAAAHLITVSEAAAQGMSWSDLQTRRWRRVHVGVYARSWLEPTSELMLKAAQRRLPPDAAFCGRTAAWLHRWEASLSTPVELVVPPTLGVTRRAAMVVHRGHLRPDEVMVQNGFRVTSPLRTAADLGSGRDLIESVVLLDSALRSGLVTVAELEAQLGERAGSKGAGRLRRALALAEPRSESPMETRLRLILVLNRLPVPIAQAELSGRDGAFIARVDLYYPAARLCIEYDGGTHRDSLREDNRRQNLLVDAGYTLLRFTAADLANPARVVALVRRALRAAAAAAAPRLVH